jgi:hypothetical protein
MLMANGGYSMWRNSKKISRADIWLISILKAFYCETSQRLHGAEKRETALQCEATKCWRENEEKLCIQYCSKSETQWYQSKKPRPVSEENYVDIEEHQYRKCNILIISENSA